MEIKASSSCQRWGSWHAQKGSRLFLLQQKSKFFILSACITLLFTKTCIGTTDSSNNPESSVSNHQSLQLCHLKRVCQEMSRIQKCPTTTQKFANFKKTSFILTKIQIQILLGLLLYGFFLFSFFFYLFYFCRKGKPTLETLLNKWFYQ